MKRVCTLSLSLGLGTAFSSGTEVLAQTPQLTDRGQAIQLLGSSVVIPKSSIAQPEDLGRKAHTNTRFMLPKSLAPSKSQGPQSGPSPLVGPPVSGLWYETPGSLSCLYGLVARTAGCNPNTAKTVPATKGSRAIAIVDAFDYPTALADLRVYSTQFGLPAPNLVVKFATSAGACNGSRPANDPGWELEEALDIEMAHAMAPKATIYLVEAQSSSIADLLGAVKCANSLLTSAGGGELSMSWGASEFPGETAYDAAYFSTPNVVYFAASGDSFGAIGDDPRTSWPSTSPKVISVGGTTIQRTLFSFDFEQHNSWVDGGGGASAFYARPSYQNSIASVVGSHRGTPDIAAVANPDTGVWVYDTGWFIVGGTSVASPLLAGIANATGKFRASTAAELTAIYYAKAVSPTTAFTIPASGYCGPRATYAVASTWNFCVGVGTVREPLTPLLGDRGRLVLEPVSLVAPEALGR